jgi:hypothetical protein
MRRAVVVLALALAACDGSASQPPASDPSNPTLGVSNGTTLVVTLVVNGKPVGMFPPGGPGPTIDVAALPPLPWTVDARSPSGRVLTSMRVEPGQVTTTTVPGVAIQHSGTMGRVDLSCGRLTIWAGDVQPSGPVPTASPGTPGDCVP